MQDRAELAAWLRLLETPGLGLETARVLLAQAGSPQEVFERHPSDWAPWLTPAQRQALASVPERLPALLARTWDWLQAGPDRQILLLGDADYPPALLHTADPPLLLYLLGRRELLGAAQLAIVGSRSPTPQGRGHAESFAGELSRAGLAIVSGLALGIDGAAHRGALSADGDTVAVVGTGLDQIYPRRHQELGGEIARRGLLISEYALGMPALPPNFPRRNRIIAGLAQGCLVVEAALQSGSLITARLASEAGREVFAIPGSILSPQSRGCHALIRQGAKLVETVQDVLDELPPTARLAAAAAAAAPSGDAAALFSPAEREVLAQMGFEPVSLDQLQLRGGWPLAELSAHLLGLELAGAVARLPGQLFQCQARG
ncbi:MAG: DNA-processing protein DprA [Burkholderiaceae bacterium]